jgi:hypothetical protein
MQNIAGKKRALQRDVDSDYLFGNFLQAFCLSLNPRLRIPSTASAELRPGWNDASGIMARL